MKSHSISLLLLHVLKYASSLNAETLPPKAKAKDPRSKPSSFKRNLNEARAARWYELGQGVLTLVENENFSGEAGHCVATSSDGQILAVSSPLYRNKNKNELNNGRVRVFGFDPIRDKWVNMGSDIMGEEFSEFGSSISMDSFGKTLVIGMPVHDNDSGKEAGSVKVYSFENVGGTGEEEWIQMGPILKGENQYDHFGAAVSMSHDGRGIAVGSPNEEVLIDGNIREEVGVVRLYKHNPEEWTRLYKHNPEEWTRLYKHNPEEWVEIAKIKGGLGFEHFGTAIGLGWNRQNAIELGWNRQNLVVGAPDHGPYGSGMIRFFDFNGENGAYTQVGEVPSVWAGDRFGVAVDMSWDGKTVIAGAPRHKGNDYMALSGHAHVYQRVEVVNATDSSEPPSIKWERKGQSLVGLEQGDQAGTSVSVSGDGNTVAVGSAYSDKMGKNSGRIKIYLWDGVDSWEDMDLDVEGHGPLDYLGTSVSLSQDGTEVAVGAPGGQYAKIFALKSTQPPTMSPTDFNDNIGDEAIINKKGHGLRVFLNVFVFLLVVSLFVAIYLGTQMFKVRTKHRAVPPSDLEMKKMEDESEEAEIV
uniref:Uncharacterized protein n=1 Tax=Chaetoceros debilis TaxID=122233 RepID=A0A7S3Q9Q8_9STRA